MPCYIEAGAPGLALASGGEPRSIGNIAATTLHLLGFEAPEGYLPSLIA